MFYTLKYRFSYIYVTAAQEQSIKLVLYVLREKWICVRVENWNEKGVYA